MMATKLKPLMWTLDSAEHISQNDLATVILDQFREPEDVWVEGVFADGVPIRGPGVALEAGADQATAYAAGPCPAPARRGHP